MPRKGLQNILPCKKILPKLLRMKLEDFRKVHNFDKLFTYDLAVSNALSSSLIRFHSNASIEIGTKKMP